MTKYVTKTIASVKEECILWFMIMSGETVRKLPALKELPHLCKLYNLYICMPRYVCVQSGRNVMYVQPIDILEVQMYIPLAMHEPILVRVCEVVSSFAVIRTTCT